MLYSEAKKIYHSEFEIIESLLEVLRKKEGVTITVWYKLTTPIIGEDDPSRRCGYSDSWYRTNYFHPLEELDPHQSPPGLRARKYRLRRKPIGNPLSFCFHPECEYHHGSTLFCSQHSLLDSYDFDTLIKERLKTIANTLNARFLTPAQAPTQLSIEYQDDDDNDHIATIQQGRY